MRPGVHRLVQRYPVLRRLSRLALGAVIAAGCASAGCVRAPAPLDVRALIAAHGEAGARGELEVHLLDQPRDVQARLALARLADRAGRPSQAIEQLEAVLRLGGPLGTRWHAEDRERFARLLRVRGVARLGRESATALADLERARSFGAQVDAIDLARARSHVAIDQLRHVDARTRAAGARTLAELRDRPFADPSWVGALGDAAPRDRGLFGVWLWRAGARRAAYEALSAWRATTAERDAARSELHAAYLRALAWWTPLDTTRSVAAELVGPERCRFVACSAAEILDEPDVARRTLAIAAVHAGPLAPTTDGREAAAWAALALAEMLDGESDGRAGWGARIAQRVSLAALDLASVPAFARPLFARLLGRSGDPVDSIDSSDGLAPHARLVVAAERALAGQPRARVEAALGDLAATAIGQRLVAIVEPQAPEVAGDPREAAISAYLAARSLPVPDLAAILAGYRRDPAVADRLARDVVARAPDAAIANAALGALWSVLDDPARARTAWQAAVDASPEPAFVAGLADAAARAGDPDAALIHGTTAAAAAGDPALVWTSLSRVLEGVGSHHHALEAARSAIDLASREALAPALDAGIAASRAMGRSGQVERLSARRARLAPPVVVVADAGPVDAAAALRAIDDPTDTASALAAYARRATASSIARLWIASRWSPGDVPVRAALVTAIAEDDPRRAVIVRELVALAGSPDPETGRAAIRALARY